MKTPLLFVGHGNPMNAIEDNAYSLKWKEIGTRLEKPKAIVCMSAHWLTQGSFITSNLEPEIIYDFYGFPEKLYHVQYPAKGSREIADKIHTCEKSIELNAEWGIDHGAWSVLKRMFPNASVPVLQLSIDFSRPPSDQIELMGRLKQMRDEGIMFIGSGNIVHNLGLVRMNGGAYDWASDFEQKAKGLISNKNLSALINYHSLGLSAQLAIPTDDHYRPLLNTLALCDDKESASFFNEGIDMGSVSMLSFVLTP
jgi:4,5-DOPA dioxygenase extradiol